jgi:hypothetical protein
VLSKTTLEAPCTKLTVPVPEDTVIVLIRVRAPVVENAPASAIVIALEIIATIKPPSD